MYVAFAVNMALTGTPTGTQTRARGLGILGGKEHEYEVNMGCGLYQAWYLPDSLMWVVEAEGTICAFTVDDRAGKVGPA